MRRLDRLTDAQRQAIEYQLHKDPQKRGKGYPHAPLETDMYSGLSFNFSLHS